MLNPSPRSTTVSSGLPATAEVRKMSSTNAGSSLPGAKKHVMPVPASRSSVSSSQRPRVSCISLPNSSVTADLEIPPVQGGGKNALAAVHDRDDHLAGDVAAHDQGVAAVELAGVQELAQAHLRAVDVGGEVDLPVSHVGSLPLPRGARTRARAARSGRAPSSAATWTARR